MRLSGLALRHFRNLDDQDLELPSEGVAVIGDNAQGKSNLLESIYYLETFRSFRGARDDHLVAFGEEVFRVAGTLTGDSDPCSTEVAAAFQRRGRKKKVTVDGWEPERMGDALGRLAAVVFSPSDVALVSEGPSERRRFLDIVLSLSVAGYLQALQRFRQILRRRNALLKRDEPAALVMAFDRGLVEAGARIALARKAWVEDRAAGFRGYYESVSGGVPAGMEYRSSVPMEGVSSPDEAAEAYRDALVASASRERRAGVTVVGPHRDELKLVLGVGEEERDLRRYGSGGQRRTAALALRMVEARTIREVRGQEPIVLLDDVFAELDDGRSERVLDLMEREETGQVVLAAPKDGDVKLRADRLPRWRIRNGRISG